MGEERLRPALTSSGRLLLGCFMELLLKSAVSSGTVVTF